MPRLRGRELDTTEEVIGQGKTRKLKSTGPAREALEPNEIEIIDRPVEDKLGKAWADNMQFNEEEILVMVHESTDKNAEMIVEVFCNGIPQRFVRGKEQKVKRKFVAVLAQAKQTTYSQQMYHDANGIESIREVPHTAVRYPFSVKEDPSPLGRAWLQALLAQG